MAAELSVVYNYKDLFSTEPVVLVVSPLNSSAKSFYENIYNFKKRLRARGYPHNLIEKITSEVTFTIYPRLQLKFRAQTGSVGCVAREKNVTGC